MGSVRSDAQVRARREALLVLRARRYSWDTAGTGLARDPCEGLANKSAQQWRDLWVRGDPGTHRPVSLRMASPWIPITPGGRILLRQSGPCRAPYQPARPRTPPGRRAPHPSRPVPSGGSHYV